MKCLFYIMVVLMLPLLAIRCTQKDDDYYTQAMVTLQVPDTITPIEMQGTVVLKNLSNGRSYTVSTFQENTATINVLRGAYMTVAATPYRHSGAPLPPSTCCVVRICSMPKVRCATEWQTEQKA